LQNCQILEKEYNPLNPIWLLKEIFCVHKSAISQLFYLIWFAIIPLSISWMLVDILDRMRIVDEFEPWYVLVGLPAPSWASTPYGIIFHSGKTTIRTRFSSSPTTDYGEKICGTYSENRPTSSKETLRFCHFIAH
jgi:hypothetical protein